MRKLFLGIIVVLFCTGSYSQENSQDFQTLFSNKGERSNGGYGAIMVNYSEINKRDAILIGARGAWLINHSFSLGLGGYGFMNDPVLDNTPINSFNSKYQTAGGYGGILLEPIIGAKKPIHLSFPILIGAGGVAYSKHWENYEDEDSYSGDYEDSDAFFVVEPGAEIEFNMVKFFRLALSVSYRYTSDIDMTYKSDRPSTANVDESMMPIGSAGMLRGWNFGIAMKFGKF